MNLLLERRDPALDEDGLPLPTRHDRWAGSLVRVALLPSAAALLLAVVAVLVTLLTADGGLGGAPGAVGAMWLVLHQIPVQIDGVAVSVLPLAPTLVLIAGIARTAARATAAEAAPRRQLQVLAAAAAGGLAATVIAVTVLDDSVDQVPLRGPGIPAVFAIVAAVHVVAAAIGVAVKVHRQWLDRWAMPQWLPSAVRTGVAGMLALLSAGAVLIALALIVAWSQVAGIVEQETTAVGRIGLLVVSLLYLPNVIVFGTGVLMGGTVEIGAAGYSAFEVVPGPRPQLPVLAVLPDEPIGGAWQSLLLVGLAVSVLLARGLPVAVRGIEGVRMWAVVGMVAATLCATLASFAGGELGVFDTLGMDSWTMAGFALLWCAVVPALLATAAQLFSERRAVRAGAAAEDGDTDRDRSTAEVDDDHDDESDDDPDAESDDGYAGAPDDSADADGESDDDAGAVDSYDDASEDPSADDEDPADGDTDDGAGTDAEFEQDGARAAEDAEADGEESDGRETAAGEDVDPSD